MVPPRITTPDTFPTLLRRNQLLGLLMVGLEAVENGEVDGSEAEWQAAMDRFAPLSELSQSGADSANNLVDRKYSHRFAIDCGLEKRPLDNFLLAE